MMLKTEDWIRVLNAMPDGVTIHDSSGVIQWANGQAGVICGLDPESLRGARCEQIFHIEGMGCPHANVVSGNESSWPGASISRGGRTFGIYVGPLYDENGTMTGYIRVMRDITQDDGVLEPSLWAERFTTLRQMINGIAHDVGTPLNIISGYAEYLLMRWKPDEAGYKELTTILSQTRRIAEFIKQMLDLARPSQGRIDAIGLKGFLSESVDLMGHHLRKAQVRAVLHVKTEPPLIYGDAPRLRQAFFNLLLNACQQVGHDGKLEIILEDDAGAGGFTRISLVGFDREDKGVDLSGTFKPFLSPGQDVEDGGMGLSLAKEILNDFGARFEPADTGAGGVGLVINLPRVRQAAAGKVMERDAS